MCLRIEVHASSSDGSITLPSKQKAKCKFCLTALLLFHILGKDNLNINCTYCNGLLRSKFEELVLSCDFISKFRWPSRGCCWWLEIGKYKDRIDSAGMTLKPRFMKTYELIQTLLGGL